MLVLQGSWVSLSSAAAGETALSQKISLAPALFCVCLGPVSACGLAEPWGVCGAEVVKPCPAPLSCLCSVAARIADGPSARAAGASVLLFPAVETLSRRCASSAMEN